MKSGFLTVLGPDPVKTAQYGNKYFLCKCELCGNTVSVRIDKLNGQTAISCKPCSIGLRKRKKVEVGDKYGDFEVLERIGYINRSHVCYWKCRCVRCGLEKQIQADHLKSGQNTCVACHHSSRGEIKIRELLKAGGLNFQEQYRFEGLPRYAFDFAIFGKEGLAFVIEFDGYQHAAPVKIWGGEETFAHQQERDKIKTEWCMDIGVPLVRIPHNEYGDLTLIKILEKARDLKTKNDLEWEGTRHNVNSMLK